MNYLTILKYKHRLSKYWYNTNNYKNSLPNYKHFIHTMIQIIFTCMHSHVWGGTCYIYSLIVQQFLMKSVQGGFFVHFILCWSFASQIYMMCTWFLWLLEQNWRPKMHLMHGIHEHCKMILHKARHIDTYACILVYSKSASNVELLWRVDDVPQIDPVVGATTDRTLDFGR